MPRGPIDSPERNWRTNGFSEANSSCAGPVSTIRPFHSTEMCSATRRALMMSCVITHDILTARRVADYINVLWKGRIVEAGPAEELFNSENAFVRQFLSGESQGPLGME